MYKIQSCIEAECKWTDTLAEAIEIAKKMADNRYGPIVMINDEKSKFIIKVHVKADRCD